MARSPLAAAFLPPLRLGPPFRFHVQVSTRGPGALLTVGLRDGNGAGLATVMTPRDEVSIRVVLRMDGEEVLAPAGEYG